MCQFGYPEVINITLKWWCHRISCQRGYLKHRNILWQRSVFWHFRLFLNAKKINQKCVFYIFCKLIVKKRFWILQMTVRYCLKAYMLLSLKYQWTWSWFKLKYIFLVQMLITLYLSLLDRQSTFQYQFSSYLINAELKKSMLQLYASKACAIFNILFPKNFSHC